MISCVVLAPADPGPNASEVLEQIIRALHGAQLFDIALVAEGDSALRAARPLPLVCVPAEDAGELQRLVAGLDALPHGEPSGVLVWPLESGARSTKFLVDFFHGFYTSGGRIVVQDGSDRPIIIDSSLFGALRNAPSRDSLQAFLEQHAGDLRRVSPRGEP